MVREKRNKQTQFLSIFIVVLLINNYENCHTIYLPCLTKTQSFLRVLNMSGLLFLPLIFALFRLPSRYLLCYINDVIVVGLFWLPIEFDLFPRDKAASLKVKKKKKKSPTRRWITKEQRLTMNQSMN